MRHEIDDLECLAAEVQALGEGLRAAPPPATPPPTPAPAPPPAQESAVPAPITPPIAAPPPARTAEAVRTPLPQLPAARVPEEEEFYELSLAAAVRARQRGDTRGAQAIIEHILALKEAEMSAPPPQPTGLLHGALRAMGITIHPTERQQ